MKKIIVLAICFGLFITGGALMVCAEDEKPVLTIVVNADGSFTATATYSDDRREFTEYNLLGIYKQGDVIAPLSKENRGPLVWWVPSNGRALTYPDNKFAKNHPNRIPELSNGEGSALLPGKYIAVISGKGDRILAGPVEFEIPEITVTPTPTEYPETPTPDPTATPTESPAPEKTPARTASPTAPVTPAATPEATPHTTGNDGKTALWICLGAAVLAAAGITAIVIMRKKKTKN